MFSTNLSNLDLGRVLPHARPAGVSSPTDIDPQFARAAFFFDLEQMERSQLSPQAVRRAFACAKY